MEASRQGTPSHPRSQPSRCALRLPRMRLSALFILVVASSLANAQTTKPAIESASSGWTAIHHAAWNCDSAAMKKLLDSGADPNQRIESASESEFNGQTPL